MFKSYRKMGIKTAIETIIDNKFRNTEIYVKKAVVKSVNNLTASVLPIGEKSEVEAYLTVYGSNFVITPEIDSLVLIAFETNTTPYVFKVDTIKEILIDNGQNGGLIKINKLVAELEKINEILNGLLSVINGTPLPTATTGLPDVLQVALKTALIGKQTPVYTDIENEKIKH